MMSNQEDDGFSADEIEQDEEETNNRRRDEGDQVVLHDDSEEQQQEDDNDDSDEHLEDIDYDADESEEQEEEDEVDDDDEYQQHWETLQTFCSRLRRNETVSFCERYPWKGVPILDDEFALELAESLKKNVSLKELILSIYEDVTKQGAQAVSSAIECSAAVSLTIDDWNEENYGEENAPTGLFKYIYPTSTMKNLEKLTINYDLGNAEMEWIGIALRNNERLEHLTLRLGFHPVEDAAAQAFADGVNRPTVSTLKLHNATPEVCDILLAAGILCSPQLRHFAISNDHEWDRIEESPLQESDLLVGGLVAAERLLRVSHLESLHLEWCYLNIQNLQVIAWTMQGNSSLKELRLISNGLEDDSAQHLGLILEGGAQVESLVLYSLWFTGSGLETLLTAVSTHLALKSLTLDIHFDSGCYESSRQDWPYDGQHFPLELRNSCSAVLVRCNRGLRLEEFAISFSRISVAGIHQILKASTTWPFVTKLEIENTQRNIGHKGLALLADALVTAKISRFSLFVLDKDKSEDAEAKQKGWNAAFRGVVLAVKSNPNIQELNVNGTTDEIQFFLNLNKYGRQLLRLDHDVMPLGLWSHVLARHGQEAGAVFYFLRELPHLILSSLVKVPRDKRPRRMIQQSTTADETRKRQR